MKHELLMLVTTPTGHKGFFRVIPPEGTAQLHGGLASFHLHSGPVIQAQVLRPGRVQLAFYSAELLAAFSDYVTRAGGQAILEHQLEAYRAALQEWLE